MCEEASALVNEVTWGKIADKVICTMGVGDGRLMESIMQLRPRGDGGRDQHRPDVRDRGDPLLTWLTLLEKQVVGTIFGSANIRYDIPHLLRLYRPRPAGSRRNGHPTYKLEDVNAGYADMLAARTSGASCSTSRSRGTSRAVSRGQGRADRGRVPPTLVR